MADPTDPDVLVIGGGVAGRSAAIFTARAGLETLVVNAGNPLLARNAHLENYPGFPAGVNARLLLDMMAEQLERSGATTRAARIDHLGTSEVGFLGTTTDGDSIRASHVIAATKNEVGYFADLPGVDVVDHGKPFVETDGRGRTGQDRLYAAGRLAQKPHQAIVCAGHGAEVAVTLLEDIELPFYHDWIAPTGYFTGRDRDVPPGCEEISEPEFRRREAESMRVMREHFAESHPESPQQHPSVDEP